MFAVHNFMAEAKLAIYNTEGKPAREAMLPAAVAGFAVKPSVVHQVAVAYAAGKRAGTAHTKTRDEVRGGGKKPWKQKGTGRARHGSTRSPIWIGGGVVHGPRNTRNWEQRLPEKLKRVALAMVVADYLKSGKVIVVESWPTEQKTKVFAALFKELKLARSCAALLLEEEKGARQGLANLSRVEVMGLRQLNAYDGLRYPKWVVSAAGFAKLCSIVSA